MSVRGEGSVADCFGVEERAHVRELELDLVDRAGEREGDGVVVAHGEAAVLADVQVRAADLPTERQVGREATLADALVAGEEADEATAGVFADVLGADRGRPRPEPGGRRRSGRRRRRG